MCVAGKGKIYVMETHEQECRLVTLLELGQEGGMKVFTHPQNIEFGTKSMTGRKRMSILFK